jgi:hypothetical protein
MPSSQCLSIKTNITKKEMENFPKDIKVNGMVLESRDTEAFESLVFHARDKTLGRTKKQLW